jgi:hypothetical protein
LVLVLVAVEVAFLSCIAFIIVAVVVIDVVINYVF